MNLNGYDPVSVSSRRFGKGGGGGGQNGVYNKLGGCVSRGVGGHAPPQFKGMNSLRRILVPFCDVIVLTQTNPNVSCGFILVIG